MVTYDFYHLIGVKVGVTIDIDARGSVLREDERYDGPLEIIERMTRECDDPESWQIVGDREWELQDQYGYPRDKCHYREARERLSLAGKKGGPIGGPKGGKRVGELGLTGFQTGAAGRIGGTKSRGRVTKNRGTHWFNNSVIERQLSECPEGFSPGRLKCDT
jgi:hypothetical protein